MSTSSRFRNPKYIGSNRCIPCTIANTGIAILLSIGILTACLLFFNLPQSLALTLAGGFFIFSLTAIYFRGYLIPGTPELTKQYFPDRVLSWFDKSHTTTFEESKVAINPEEVLLGAGVVESCQNKSDLCLTPSFKAAWHDLVRDYRDQQLDEAALTEALGISPNDDQIQFDYHGNGIIARTTTAGIGQWSSNAAIIADVAAATELKKRYSDWYSLAPAEKAHVLLSLRIFLEECPTCGGPVQVKQDAVESCCRSYDVIATVCKSCGTRLLEMEWDGPENASEENEAQSQQTPA